MRFRPSFHNSAGHSPESYPDFYPHVTLVTFQTSLVPSFRTLLPPNLHATPVQFKDLRAGDTYLGSLSVTVHKYEDLMSLRDCIAHHLERELHISTKSRGFPHFSLFYLNEALPREREQLASELRHTGHVRTNPHTSSITLNCSPEFNSMTGFMGESIWLMDCTGPVADWKLLEKIKLPRASSQPSRRRSLPALDPSRPAVPIERRNERRDAGRHNKETQTQDRPPAAAPVRLTDTPKTTSHVDRSVVRQRAISLSEDKHVSRSRWKLFPSSQRKQDEPDAPSSVVPSLLTDKTNPPQNAVVPALSNKQARHRRPIVHASSDPSGFVRPVITQELLEQNTEGGANMGKLYYWEEA